MEMERNAHFMDGHADDNERLERLEPCDVCAR